MCLKRNLLLSVSFILGLCLVASLGCDQKKPDGLPKLFPCSISLVQDGKPLEGASILLVSSDETPCPWVIGGVTDASGMTTIRTHGNYTGAPKGTFSLTVTKTITEGGASGNEHAPKKQNAKKATVFTLVDSKFTNIKTTPLKITINGNTKETFDLGSSVKQPISTGDDA